MKKITSIIVLTVLLTHLIGFYLYFVVRQGQIRQEMRESIGSLPHEEFETFVLTLEDYQKIKVNGFEVKIDGKMYDHSEPKFENGKVVLHARHDKEEDNLLSLIHTIITSGDQDSKPAPAQLLSFLSLTFISDNPLALSRYLSSEKLTSPPAKELLNRQLPVESPPPRA